MRICHSTAKWKASSIKTPDGAPSCGLLSNRLRLALGLRSCSESRSKSGGNPRRALAERYRWQAIVPRGFPHLRWRWESDEQRVRRYADRDSDSGVAAEPAVCRRVDGDADRALH